MSLKSSVLSYFAGDLLGAGFCTGQELWTPDYAHPEQRWRAMLGEAGRPRGGAILELRRLAACIPGASPADAVIMVKNVSDRTISLGCYHPDVPPELLVRDRAGKMAPLTAEGQRYFSRMDAVAGTVSFRLKPGYAHGFVVPLAKYFHLVDGGSYGVFGRVALWRGRRCWLRNSGCRREESRRWANVVHDRRGARFDN